MAAHTQSCAQGATTTTAAAKKKWVFLYLSSSSSSSFLRLFVCRWCVLREKGKVFANNSIAGRYADTIHFKICFPFIFKPQKRRKKTGAKALLLPDCLKGDLFFFGSGYSLSPMWHVSSILNWTNQTPLLLERRLDIVVALVYQSKFSRVFLLLLLLLPLDRIEKKKRERTAADL